MKKVNRTRNNEEWTESMYWNEIRQALRTIFMRKWSPAKRARELAKVPYIGTSTRRKIAFKCSVCKKQFKNEEVQVHHKEHVGSLKCDADLVPFVNRLLNEDVSSYAVICKGCHQLLTNKERKLKKK